MINYVEKFSKNVADVAKPLRFIGERKHLDLEKSTRICISNLEKNFDIYTNSNPL